MSDRSVEIVLKAKDDASAKFDNVTRTLVDMNRRVAGLAASFDKLKETSSGIDEAASGVSALATSLQTLATGADAMRTISGLMEDIVSGNWAGVLATSATLVARTVDDLLKASATSQEVSDNITKRLFKYPDPRTPKGVEDRLLQNATDQEKLEERNAKILREKYNVFTQIPIVGPIMRHFELGDNREMLERLKGERRGLEFNAAQIDHYKSPDAIARGIFGKGEHAFNADALAPIIERARKAATDRIAQLQHDNRTPDEVYQDKIDEAQKLRAKGLSDELFERIRKKAQLDLGADLGLGPDEEAQRGRGATKFNNTESRFLTRGEGFADPAKQALDVQKQHLDLLKQNQEVLKKVQEHLKKLVDEKPKQLEAV